jgi:putative transposase
LESILHTSKSYTAHEINRIQNSVGAVWQDERYDRTMRNEDEFWEKWAYIADNPLKCGLVNDALTYPWLFQDIGAKDASAARCVK